ncbi:helix-turn-helix domain-containing protein [Parerythrobacter jejuensis]|uniref:Helix-turn-helix domain-containing protein n=1 Tax=Parerythrobacter jejuensis TaxID=795812 RepID=A0A845AT58_9SPHN|nr:AraC family transcriptional regulator [Parerythrobacter jejuensis]MXP32784.1 helix-turn-helix domain-containing protein [Parerythrobacter jejuensis]
MNRAESSAPIVRNAASGYWGHDLVRREVGNAVFQLHEANAPPECVTAHGHHGAHIVFVTSGAYVTSVTGENGFVATPVAVMNPPGMWHRDHFVGGRGSFMTVDLHCDDLEDGYARHDQSQSGLALLARIAACLSSADPLALEDSAALLVEKFTPLGAPERQDPGAIALAYDAIMASEEPWLLTASHLAQAACMHPNSLPRAFRNHFGRTASQIAKARQVELCADAIAKRDYPLAEAAIAFGFCDQAHMTGAFRRVTGLPPARWLKMVSQR